MANSVQVTVACVVRVYPYPPQSFSVGNIVQPTSPFYRALINAGYATDSGIPAAPAVPVAVSEPVYKFGSPNEYDSLRYDEDSGLWIPEAKKGLLAYIENATGQTVSFTTAATLNAGMVLEVPPTSADVWINWGCWLGTSVGGQGAVYTQIYEFTDSTSIQKEGALTYCVTSQPVTSQFASHRQTYRVGPSDQARSYGLFGLCVREASSTLSAYFRNLVNTFGRSWMSAEAR